jgi:hypothetical protein
MQSQKTKTPVKKAENGIENDGSDTKIKKRNNQNRRSSMKLKISLLFTLTKPARANRFR